MNNRPTKMTGMLSLALIALLAVPTLAAAYDNGSGNRGARGYGEHRGGYNNMYTNLTPEQQKIVQEKRDAYYLAIDAISKDHYMKQGQLQAELNSLNPDDAKVQGLIQEVAKLQGDMYAQEAKMRNELIEAGIPADVATSCGSMGRGRHRGNMMRGHGY